MCFLIPASPFARVPAGRNVLCHSVRYSVASQCCWLPWSCSGSPELAVIKALEHSKWRTASQSLLPATHWQGFDIRVCIDVTSA